MRITRLTHRLVGSSPHLEPRGVEDYITHNLRTKASVIIESHHNGLVVGRRKERRTMSQVECTTRNRKHRLEVVQVTQRGAVLDLTLVIMMVLRKGLGHHNSLIKYDHESSNCSYQTSSSFRQSSKTPHTYYYEPKLFCHYVARQVRRPKHNSLRMREPW